jgi:4-amino-4-deoxy-L-arabinose transferase-like glycosyltransferase
MRHPDEIFMVVFPLEFFSGDFNPHRFYYPTLHFYLLGLVYGISFMAQKLLGAGWSRVEFAVYYIFWDPDALLFWARATSVAFAMGTVVWVGALARTLYGPALGLAAAALLAVDVVHVRQTALASVDAALACWCVGAVWAAVRLLQREGMRDYALAGLLVGLAGGTKYPGAIIGGAVLVAHLLAGRNIGDRRLWFAGLITALTFAATSPYVILDYEVFLGHFLFQVAHASGGRGTEEAAWL